MLTEGIGDRLRKETRDDRLKTCRNLDDEPRRELLRGVAVTEGATEGNSLSATLYSLGG